MGTLLMGEHAGKIRPVLRSDLVKLFELEKRLFGEDKFDILLLRDLVNHSSLFLVVEDAIKSEIIGLSIAIDVEGQETSTNKLDRLVSNHTAHIVNFAIDTPFQRQGLGKKLFQYSLDELRKQGYNKARLEVSSNNLQAISLYKKFGFQQVEFLTNYYQSGADAFRMEAIIQNN